MTMYPSKYSNGKTVTAAQYITEMICENLAKRKNKDLHYRFWLNVEWCKFYKSQIFTAHKLLKKHTDKAIIAALKSDKGRKIFSLRAPHLEAIIIQQQVVIDATNNDISKEIIRVDKSIGGVANNKNMKKSIIEKLKELDNEN